MHVPRKPLVAAALLTLAPATLAQVQFPGEAYGDILPAIDSPVVLSRPDNIAALMAEDEARNHRPLRFGTSIPVEIGLQTHGQWDTAPDGTLIWRVEIVAPESKSIGLEFAHYDMPEGAKLFTYDSEMTVVEGAFDSRNENPDGEFTTHPTPGDSAILELQLPADARELPSIVVDHVIYDYRDFYALTSENGDGGGAEGGCSINANCSAGDPYPEFKRAAVRTAWNGFLCSAVLLNNTANDQTRYLYTAHHCGTGNNVVVRFNYQTATCTGGGAPSGQQVSGATLLQTDAPSDGRLMRINNPIPSTYNPYYMGWNRGGTALQLGVCFHHPGGAPKAVSVDSNGGGQISVNFSGQITQCWNITFQTGGTEGGSSGSGIMDQSGRIRGVLSGGPNNCAVSYYGRLNTFWNNDPIAQFLDPLGTGTTFVEGLDPNGGGPGNQPPVLDTISPISQLAVQPEGPTGITLTGNNFTGATDVKVNGVSLPDLPPAWAVVSNTQITLTPPQSTTLGPQTIEVVTPFGSDTIDYTVTANLFEPVIDLELSDPSFLITALGLNARIGSIPGNTAIFAVGTSPLPSLLPGLVNLDIGNNFSEVFNFGQATVDATSGYALFQVPLNNGLPLGLKLYTQGIVINNLIPTFPLPVTNVQTGTVLF